MPRPQCQDHHRHTAAVYTCWKIQTASIATVLRNRRETCKRGLNMQWEQPELRAFRSGIPSAVTELEEVVASCVPHPDVANIPLSGHVGPISQRSMRSGTRLSIQQLPSSSASRRQGDFSIRSLFSRARNSNNSGFLTTTNFWHCLVAGDLQQARMGGLAMTLHWNGYRRSTFLSLQLGRSGC